VLWYRAILPLLESSEFSDWFASMQTCADLIVLRQRRVSGRENDYCVFGNGFTGPFGQGSGTSEIPK
jgi:hypothetical protein